MNEQGQPDGKLETLLDYLKRSRGFDFTAYKRSSLSRRITKRMNTLGIDDYAAYMDYLETQPSEFTNLFNTILINVTSFFRDSGTWDFLRSEIVPKIVQSKPDDESIRVWSAGCASGQEAYSLAMLLGEALGEEALRDRVKIYGTDVDEEALAEARQAIYTEKEVSDIPADLLKKYFEQNGAVFSFRKDLRRSVIFGRHDLIQDPPISRIDLLVCRNALMYFNAETQTKVLHRFHFALNSDGYLVLGKSEMLLTHTNLFTPVDLKRRIFRPVAKQSLRERLLVLAQAGSEDASSHSPSQSALREAALDSIPIATLVVGMEGTVVHITERARALFGLGLADMGKLFRDLEISYRPVELRSVLDEVYSSRRPVNIKDVEWKGLSEGMHHYDVEITPLVPPSGRIEGASISFIDVTRVFELHNEVMRVRQELETYAEELQSTNEELETTNEELQSTNEELETTNEELQSTNEELETMNEELQSTNEELETINNELGERTQELNEVNAFQESIMASFNDAIIVMSRDMRVQVWNNAAEDLWGLRQDEVKGEHLMSLDIGLPVEPLRQPIRACLSGLGGDETIVLHATNRRGKPIEVAANCTPLYNQSKDISGTILIIKVLSQPGQPLQVIPEQ